MYPSIDVWYVLKGYIDYFHPHSKFNSVNEDKLHRQREITLTGYHRTKQANMSARKKEGEKQILFKGIVHPKNCLP